jgi:hypothetical protein
MKAIVSDWYTDIFPTNEEVKELCKPGEGPNTCVWLVIGAKGWECTMMHKNTALLSRWEKGNTVAKRDGCGKVNDFDASGKTGEVEI